MDTLHFLYSTVPGRILLKPLTSRRLSDMCGRFLDHPASRCLIPGFISANHIDMDEYEDVKYRSFNEFFCRKIRPECRPVDTDPSHLISPCDGLLSVFPISHDLVIPVKQSVYSVSSLLRSRHTARRFEGGYCMVFRLCVDNYHRYVYPDSGLCSREKTIRGVFHTVRPAALRSVPVFTENTRRFCLIRTDHFGIIAQMEVGAMLVGRIHNHLTSPSRVRKGQEKGYFQYGGSTIILLTQKDKVTVPDNYLSMQETPVRLGQTIAYAK